MCTLKDFCCCFSLATGVSLISIVNVFCSFFSYLYGKNSDIVSIVHIRFRSDYSVSELSFFYYAITAAVSFAGIFSVLSSSRCLLLPLYIWDYFRLGAIFGIFIRHVFYDGPGDQNLWIGAVLLIYCISVEYSYRKELRDGPPHAGMILAPATTVTVCTATAPSAPPSAPLGSHHSTVVPVPEEYSVQSPYAKTYPAYAAQPPYPVGGAPVQMYPAQLPYPAVASAAVCSFPANASPHSASNASALSPGAPPPYPVAQSQVSMENPPPYAP